MVLNPHHVIIDTNTVKMQYVWHGMVLNPYRYFLERIVFLDRDCAAWEKKSYLNKRDIYVLAQYRNSARVAIVQ